MACSIITRLADISLSETDSTEGVSVEGTRSPRQAGHVLWFVKIHLVMSLRQNMWPQVWFSLVTPSSSRGCAGESMACAISSSARMDRKGTKHIGHWPSRRPWEDKSSSDSEGRSSTSWLRACWLGDKGSRTSSQARALIIS